MRPISCRIPGIGTFLFQDDSGTSAVVTRPPYTCLPSETQEQMKTEAYAAVLAVCGMMAPGDKVALLTTVLRASKTYRNRYGLRKALFGLCPVDLESMETTASQGTDDDEANTQSISHPSALRKRDRSDQNIVLSEGRAAHDSKCSSPQQPQEALCQSNGAIMKHTSEGNKRRMHLQSSSPLHDTPNKRKPSPWEKLAVRLTSFLPSASGSFWISIDKSQRRKRTSFRRASRSYRAKIFKVTYELIQAVVEKFCPGVGRLDLLDRLSELHQSKLLHTERNQLDGYAHHHSGSFSVKAPRRHTPKSAGKTGRDVEGIDEPMTGYPLSIEKKSSSSLAPLDGERIDRMPATQSSSMAVLASIIESEATKQGADYQNPSHASATAEPSPLSVPYVHAPSLEVLTSMAQYVSEQVMALRPKTAAALALPAWEAGAVSGGGGGARATATGSVARTAFEAIALDGKEVKRGSVVSITSSPVSGTATGRTAMGFDRLRPWSQAFPTSNRCPDIQDLQLLPQLPLREKKRHRPQNSPSPSPLCEQRADNTEQPLKPWQQLFQALEKQTSSSVPQSEARNMVSCRPSHLGAQVPCGFPTQRPAPPSWKTPSLPLLRVPPLSSDYTVNGVFRPPFVPVTEASFKEVSIVGPS